MSPESPYREATLPEGWVPFAMDATAAAEAVAKALATAWRVPMSFRSTAKLDDLEAVWVPAWLLRVRLQGTWEAERGVERGGIEGSPTSDSDYNWTWEHGTFDEPLVLFANGSREGPGPPFTITSQGEAAGALLRDEPGATFGAIDAVRIEPDVSPAEVTAGLTRRAPREAESLAGDRCGGDQRRNLKTSEDAKLLSLQRIWLPLYRGTYTWKTERHALWVHADAKAGEVILSSQPSDAEEVAAQDALQAANRAASTKQMNRVVYIALLPFAFIMLYVAVTSLLSWLAR